MQSNSKRTPKQQARFEAATRRAQRVAQNRHRRLEHARTAKREDELIHTYAVLGIAELEGWLST